METNDQKRIWERNTLIILCVIFAIIIVVIPKYIKGNNLTFNIPFKENSIIKDSINSLIINGKVFNGDGPAFGYSVRLLNYNECIDSIWIRDIAGFSFKLKDDQHYTIEIIKKGYFIKRLSFNTFLPHKKSKNYSFEFDAHIVKEDKKINDHYFDFPAGLISYNSEADNFSSNLKYQQHMYDKISKELFTNSK